jgi:hypothetical protein
MMEDASCGAWTYEPLVICLHAGEVVGGTNMTLNSLLFSRSALLARVFMLRYYPQ